MRNRSPLPTPPVLLAVLSAVLGALGLGSCMAPTPDEFIDLVYDPCEPLEVHVRFAREKEQVVAVQEGIDLWNRRLGTRVTLRIEGDPVQEGLVDDDAASAGAGPARTPVDVSSLTLPSASTQAMSASVPLEFDYAAPAFRGYYDDEAGVVYINDRLRGEDLAITVAHELGHVFGLFHIEKDIRDSVMNRGNLKVPPNREDARAVASIWGHCDDGMAAAAH